MAVGGIPGKVGRLVGWMDGRFLLFFLVVFVWIFVVLLGFLFFFVWIFVVLLGFLLFFGGIFVVLFGFYGCFLDLRLLVVSTKGG